MYWYKLENKTLVDLANKKNYAVYFHKRLKRFMISGTYYNEKQGRSKLIDLIYFNK